MVLQLIPEPFLRGMFGLIRCSVEIQGIWRRAAL